METLPAPVFSPFWLERRQQRQHSSVALAAIVNEIVELRDQVAMLADRIRSQDALIEALFARLEAQESAIPAIAREPSPPVEPFTPHARSSRREAVTRRGLGRGLDALIPSKPPADE
jgi:hypothetical protein